MLYTVKFYEKEFRSSNRKDAYLKACKWVAQNVMAKETEIGETIWKIAEVKPDYPVFKLELYCTIDSDEHNSKFCDLCKKFHTAFYVNEEYNCDRCNKKVFEERMNEMLIIKRQYRKERLNYAIKNKKIGDIDCPTK